MANVRLGDSDASYGSSPSGSRGVSISSVCSRCRCWRLGKKMMAPINTATATMVPTTIPTIMLLETTALMPPPLLVVDEPPEAELSSTDSGFAELPGSVIGASDDKSARVELSVGVLVGTVAFTVVASNEDEKDELVSGTVVFTPSTLPLPLEEMATSDECDADAPSSSLDALVDAASDEFTLPKNDDDDADDDDASSPADPAE
jgi:hypothetical protein